MKRFTTVLLGAAAAALLPAIANAAPLINSATTQFTTGGIDVTAPVDGTNIEVAGPKTTAVIISAPAGTFTTVTTPLTIDVVVFIHDANGVVQSTSPPFTDVLNGGGVVVGAGGILAPTTIDFSMSGPPANLGTNLGIAINTARTFVNNGIMVSGGGVATGFGIGIVVNDAVDSEGADTLLDLANETNDEIIDADDAGPLLTSVFRDLASTPQRMIFVFDDNISTSTFANLTNVDFESDTVAGFTNPTVFAGAAFTANATLIGSSNNRAMEFPIVINQENLAPSVGDFARIALAGGPPAVNADLTDLALNVTDMQPAIQITSVTAPTITGAKWTTTISAAGTGVLRVDFSANVNSAALGDLDFWDGLAGAGGTSIVPSTAFTGGDDLQVTAVNAFDPTAPSSVFLTVTSTGAATIAPDGKDDASGGASPRSFNLSVDTAVGVPPQDFLGTALTGTANVAIGDDIAPVAVGGPFTLDTDGDGVIDAFGLNFTEPIDVSSADTAGFTLTKLAGTVHPFSLFNTNLTTTQDPTDALNQATVVLDTVTPANDQFQSTILSSGGFTRQSQDPTAANRLQTFNTLVVNFNSAGVDWDNDGAVGTADTDGEATPGTFDTNFAKEDIDAALSKIKDANGVAMTANVVGGAMADGAGPVAARVDFVTGDNIVPATTAQKPSEKDGTVGDNANNNTAFVIFNEQVANAGIDETKFRFGVSATERFAAGDFIAISGTGNNIVSLKDNAAGGFGAGDTFTIAASNGLTDVPANAFGGTSASGAPTLTVLDGSAPYVILQQDINGAVIHSAFLGGIDSNGFATTLTLTFSRNIKAGTGTTAADWNIEGVGTPPSDPILSGNTLTFSFPSGLVAASNVITITYNGATAAAADLITADGGTMAPVAAMNDTFSARKIPNANVDGEFMSVLDIGGTITDTDGSTAAQDGTKVFGFISAPRARSATWTMGGVTATVTSSQSMTAITNALLGIESNLYLVIGGPEMEFTNDKTSGLSGTIDQIIDINLNVLNMSNVTFTGSGSTTGTAAASGSLVSISSGSVDLCWDVLRSSDGTAFSLFNGGYVIGGQPIASSAVVITGDGAYLLHMTAPISAFNGALNAIGWPVILVVELPSGKRFPVTSLLNAVDGQGPISFSALNRQSDPFNSDANLAFNPNLGNIATQGLYQGWNSLPDDRSTGWQSAINGILLPGSVNPITLLTGTSLSNINALDQFVYFLDTNNDGMWTNADDAAGPIRFSGLTTSTECLTNSLVFTMTDKGVKVGEDVKAFSGGYAAGFFNGNANRIGVFQFGPAMQPNTSTPNSVFLALTGSLSFPNNLTTLGWGFITSPNTTTNIATFLSDNASDFLILFNRTGNNTVSIKTFGTNSTGSSTSGDATSITRGDALFLHKQ